MDRAIATATAEMNVTATEEKNGNESGRKRENVRENGKEIGTGVTVKEETEIGGKETAIDTENGIEIVTATEIEMIGIEGKEEAVLKEADGVLGKMLNILLDKANIEY